MVTPSYLLAIVDEMERQGIDPARTSLKVGIFGAEPWTDDMRTEIEQRLDMHAVDIYGLSEVIGPGVARSASRPRTGCTSGRTTSTRRSSTRSPARSCPTGEIGELVFTSLTKQAMPVIRYRTRDLTRLLPGTARTMRRMERITGRTDDMMIVRGVNVFPTQVEELLLRGRPSRRTSSASWPGRSARHPHCHRRTCRPAMTHTADAASAGTSAER